MSDKVPIVSFYRVITPPTPSASSKAALKSRIVKVISSDPSIPHERIQEALKEVSEQFSEEKSLKEVHISQEKSSLKITVVDQSGEHEVKTSVSSNAKQVTIQRLRSDFGPSKTWLQKFSKDVQTLHPTGSIAFGVVVAFETLIFPLSALGYALFALVHSLRSSMLSSAKEVETQQELQKLLGPSSYDHFLASMGAVVKLSQRLKDSSTEIYSEITKALNRGEKIKEVHEGKKDGDSFWNELRAEVDKSSEQSPLTLPCGSYIGDTFVPSLLLIYKNPKTPSHYVVKEISYDPREEAPSEKTQVLHNFLFSSKYLKKFVLEAINLSKAPPALSLEEQRRVAKAKSSAQPATRKTLLSFSETGMARLLSSYEKEGTCTEISLSGEEESWAFASASSDPLSLLSLFARKPFLELEARVATLRKDKERLEKEKSDLPASDEKEISKKELEITTLGERIQQIQADLYDLAAKNPELTDKASFLHLYVSELCRKLLRYSDTLTPATREFYFRNLEERVKKLERRLVKTYGPLIASQFASTIRSNIDKAVRASLNNTGKKLSLRQKTVLNAPLPETHPRVALNYTEAKKAEIAPQDSSAALKTTSSAVGQSIFQKSEQLKKIENVFSSTAAPSSAALSEALQELSAINQSADHLIEIKNYGDARLYLQAALSLLPSVGNIRVLDALNTQQREQFLQTLNSLQKNFLEVKLRLEVRVCSTKEMLSIFNAKMLSVYFLHKASNEIIDREFISKWSQLPSDLKAQIFTESEGERERPSKRALNTFKDQLKELLSEILNKKSELSPKNAALFSLLQGLSLSEKDLILLLSTGVPIDHTLAHEILKNDPLLELSRDPSFPGVERSEAMLNAIQDDMNNVSMFLRNVSPAKIWPALFELTARLMRKEESSGLSYMNSLFKTAQSSSSTLFEDASLPGYVQQIKWAEFFEQGILETESSFYPTLSVTAAESLPLPESSSEKQKRAQEIQQKHRLLQDIIREMPGRLRVEMKDSPFSPSSQTLALTSEDAAKEHALFFHPGALPEESASYTTPVDKTLTAGLIGQKYAPLCVLRCGKARSGNSQTYSVTENHSIPQMFSWAKEEPIISDVEPEIETSLASMDTMDPVSVILALRFIVDNPLLLSHPLVAKRLENILYKNDWLAASFLAYGSIWSTLLRSGALQKVYDQSLKRNDVSSALFMLGLFHQIRLQSAKAQKSLSLYPSSKDPLVFPSSFRITAFCDALSERDDPTGENLAKTQEHLKNIDKALHNLASLSSGPSAEKNLSFVFSVLEDSKDLDLLMPATERLIPLLDAGTLQDMKTKDLARFLVCWRELQENASAVTGMNQYFIAQEKMELELLPALQSRLSNSAADEQELLSALLLLKIENSEAPRKSWTRTEVEYEYIIPSDTSGPFEYRIDLKRGVIESATSKGSAKLQEIPLATTKDPHFRQVFGEAFLQGSAQTLGTSERYSVQQDGIKYRIEIDTTTKKVVQIEREIGGKWLQHLPANLLRDSSNFGALVQQKGLWQDPDQRDVAWLFLKGEKESDPRSHASNIKLELSPDNTLKKAMTSKGKVVCIDTNKQLESIFAICDRKNLLFLRDPHSKVVDEVAFIQEGFSLKKEGEAWVPSHKEKGWSLPQDTLSSVIARFGLGSLQVLLPLVRTSSGRQETEYVIWARPIIANPLKRATPQLNIAPSENPSLLSLYKDSQDNLSGSHAAFLYMSMVCLAQGDLTQAALLLEQMSGRGAHVKAEELALIEELQKQLSTFPASTDRVAAFLLKAELSINRIKREQYKVVDHAEKTIPELLQKTSRTLKLFHRYKLSLESLEKQASLRRSHLTLTDEELGEADSLSKHSLQNLLEISLDLPAKAKESLTRPESVDVNFILYLQSLSAPAAKITLSSTKDNEIPLTKELLVNFWSYASAIQEKSVRSSFLSSLTKDIPLSTDIELTSAIDTARRFLLTLSLTCQNDPSFKISIPKNEDIFKLKSFLDIKGRLSEKQEEIASYLLTKLKAPFEALLQQAAKTNRSPILYKAEADLSAPDEKIEIQTMKQLAENPSLSLEEKILYKKAFASLEASSETSSAASLTEWLKRLHEMKVMVLSKRHITAFTERIRSLEHTDVRLELPSFPTVSLNDITSLSPSTSQVLKDQFSSYSLNALSDVEIEGLLQSLEAGSNTSLKTLLEEDLSSLVGATRMTEESHGQPFINKYKDVRIRKFLQIALTLKRENELPQLASDLGKNIKTFFLTYNNFEKQREKELVQAKLQGSLAAFPMLIEEEAKANPMKAREILRLRAGVKEAAEENIRLIEGSQTRVLPLDAIDPFEKALQTDLKALQEQTKALRKEIIKTVRPFAGELGLYPQLSEPLKYSQEEVLSALLDLYEDGNLAVLEERRTKVEKDITTYLLLSTKAHLIEKALDEPIGSLTQLHSLKDRIQQIQLKRSEESEGPARKRLKNELIELSLEWKASCMELFKKIDRGYDLTFFSDDKTSPVLSEPFISRAALVFGYRQKIGVTKDQITIIKKLLSDPSALEELRMGLGKSFVISPLVARLMAKKGVLPVVIFTEELIQQSRKDMDKRAYEFRFQRNPTLSSQQLADEYKTLLEIKTSGRYIVTTIGRLAALENKFHELKGMEASKKKILDSLLSALPTAKDDQKVSLEQEKEKILTELTDLSNQLLWIQKIYLFFDPTAHGTRFFVDEVDAVLHISSEINYSEGLSENVDALTHTAGDDLFRKLFASTDPSLQRFAEALASNKQASFPEQSLDKALFQLSLSLTQDADFLRKIGNVKLNASQKETLAAYLCGRKVPSVRGSKELIAAPRPDFLPDWPKTGEPSEAMLTLSSYKHFLTKTIPTLCSKSYGIDFGLASDGFTIVPMEEGRAKPNTMFGEEAELIGYHLVAYYQDGCSSKEFFSRILTQIQAKASSSPTWKAWLTLVGMPEEGAPNITTLYSHFKAPTQQGRDLRARFLEFMLLHTSSVQIYRKQIPLLVQNIIAERDFSGASGTMNKEALPGTFTKSEKAGDPRSITGDLLMRIAMMEEAGLSAKAGVYQDPMEQMARLSSDKKCKAIINIGAAFVGKSTLDVIAELRKTSQGKSRQFIFIHPTEKTAYFWDVDASIPKPFDKVKDASQIDPELCIYYFSPADTRGTDFKIPSGYGAVITGPTTTLPKLEQAVWRLRKLGMGHSAKFYVEKSLAARILSRTEKSSSAGKGVNVAEVIIDILEQTVAEDSLSNFKLQAVNPSSIVKKHVKDMLLRLHSNSTVSAYEMLEDPKKEKQYLERVESQSVVYTILKGYFSRVQEMNYKADYEAASVEDPLRFLSKVYDAEIDKVDDLISILRAHSSTVAENALQALRQARGELEKTKQSLISDEGRLRGVLPPSIASNASLDAGAQSEIQQQQQQTLTSQVKRFTSSNASTGPVDPDREPSDLDKIPAAQFDFLARPDLKEMFLETAQKRQEAGFIKPSDGLYPKISLPEGMYFTASTASLLELGKAQGKMDSYLFDTGTEDFCVLSASDLPSILLLTKKFPEGKIHALSLQSDSLLPLFDANPATSSSDDFLFKRAISKTLLGGSVFSEGEEKALKSWYDALPSEERENFFVQLRKLGGVDIAEKLERWHESAPYVSPFIKPESKIEDLNRTSVPRQRDEIVSPATTPQSLSSIEDNPESPAESPRTERTSTPPDELLNLQEMENAQKMNYFVRAPIESLLGVTFKQLYEALNEAKFTLKEEILLERYAKEEKGLDLVALVEAFKKFDVMGINAALKSAFKVLSEIRPYIEKKTLRDYFNEYIKPPEIVKAPVRLSRKPPTSFAIKPVALPRSSGIEPLSAFIIDKGGKGNCGSLSLLDQINRRGITKESGALYNSQQELRDIAKDYLLSHTTQLAEANITDPSAEATLFAAIEESLLAAREDKADLPASVLSALDKIKESTAQLSIEQKTTLLQAYAEAIGTDGFWLDKGFFAVAAAALNRQVVIVRPGTSPGSFVFAERFPQGLIDINHSLFIYYNGTISNGRGYHFQSVDLTEISLLTSLIYADKQEKIDNFLKGLQEQSTTTKTPDQKISGLKIYLQDLQKLYPDAYRAVLDLLSERLRMAAPLSSSLTDDQTLLLLDSHFHITRSDIEAKIASLEAAARTIDTGNPVLGQEPTISTPTPPSSASSQKAPPPPPLPPEQEKGIGASVRKFFGKLFGR